MIRHVAGSWRPRDSICSQTGHLGFWRCWCVVTLRACPQRHRWSEHCDVARRASWIGQPQPNAEPGIDSRHKKPFASHVSIHSHGGREPRQRLDTGAPADACSIEKSEFGRKANRGVCFIFDDRTLGDALASSKPTNASLWRGM